jgi:hypothetical protein
MTSPPADAPAGDGRDDRLVGGDPDRRNAAPQLRQVGDVGAGGKGAAAGAGQDCDPLPRVVELGESLLQLDRDRFVDRVQLLGPVYADDRDRAAFLDADDTHLLLLARRQLEPHGLAGL